MQVSQGGEKGGSSKLVGDEKGNVVGRVFSTQIFNPIPTKLVQIMTTTTSYNPNFKIDMSKLQSKKGLTINEDGSFDCKACWYFK